MHTDRAQDLEALIDALPQALLLIDRGGRVLHANAAAETLLGRPAAVLTSLALDALVREPSGELDAFLKRCARSRQMVPGALLLVPPALEPRVRCDGALVRAADGARSALLLLRLRGHAAAVGRFIELNRRIDALTREVERRRTAERHLEEQREWMRVTLRSIGDAVITTGVDGLVSFMNPVAERLTGWREDDARGQAIETVVAIVDAASRLPIASPVRCAIAEREPVSVANHALLIQRDGDELPIDDIAAPIVDDAGRLLGAVLILRDVSERLAADSRRRSLEAQLREMQKTQAIGTLAGGIAHDFNNVLGSILGNTALAHDEVEAGHAARERIVQIDAAARRARRLVKQILAFTRRSPRRVQRQALNGLVEEVLVLLRSTVPAMVSIEARLPSEPVFVEADATQLHQVLMNLCTNAWHALRGSTGRVLLTLELADLSEAQVAPPAVRLPPGHYVRIAVSDDGCGMDEATRARMFEPFFTTKPMNEGTGLGLAVVQGIVAEHHGAIDVESAVGAGTTVSVYLPRAESLIHREGTPGFDGVTVFGGGERVLYVDDDEMMAVTTEALLRRAGYDVTAFNDPQAALAAVQATPDVFDLAITDFNMPQLSGLQLAWALRRLRPDLPLVITSGYVASDLRMQVQRLGRCRLLNKENLSDEVAGLVSAMLASRDAELSVQQAAG